MHSRPEPHHAIFPGSSVPPLLAALRLCEFQDVHWASLRRQISMNCLMSEISEGILAAVDGRVVKVRWNSQKRLSAAGQIVVVSKDSLNGAFPFSS